VFKLGHSEPFVFGIDHLKCLGESLHGQYISAQPFPHIVIEDFLPLKDANRLLALFPRQDSTIWLDWKKRDTIHQPKKQGIGDASRLDDAPPYLQNMISAFNSYAFLNFLEKLTGINKILPDPYLHGGGLHQILSGGRLAIHTDFNDLKKLDLYRRINVLFFLNKNWKPQYNGNLELWDKDLRNCVHSIQPLFNRLVVFNTNKKSFHGHPHALATPTNVTRKSLALYYYTAKPEDGEEYDNQTDWQVV